MEHFTTWDIYWIMQADVIQATFAWIGFIAGFAAVMTLFAMAITETYNHHGWASVSVAAGICITFVVAAAFWPNTKTQIAMYGIPAAISITADIELDETARKSIEAVNKLLDTYLEGNK